jgi:hypothetical protein
LKIRKEMKLFVIGCLEFRTNYLRFVQIQARHWISWMIDYILSPFCNLFDNLSLSSQSIPPETSYNFLLQRKKLFIEFQEE